MPDTVPDIPLVEIPLSDLTTQTADGNGVFDVLMRAVSEQLNTQFKSQRITGSDYATVYTSTLASVLQVATQFVLGQSKTQAEVNLLNAQTVKTLWDVKTAEIQLMIAQATLRRTDAEVELMQQRVLTERAQIDGSVIEPNSILDGQRELLRKQTEGFLRDAEQKAANILWDVYKVLISVGEDTDAVASGATEPNMKLVLQKVMEGINVTIP